MTEAEMQTLQGLGVSDGIAIGRTVCLQSRHQEIYRFPLPEDEVPEELERFRKACRRARHEVEQLSGRVGREIGEDMAGIFEAHALLLADQRLIEDIESRIRSEHVNAEWAVWEATEELEQRFLAMGAELFQDRSQDLRDVRGYLLRSLQGFSHHELSEIGDDVLVIADDLTPSEAVRLGRQGVAGFALEAGGRTSHTAIIAHSLNIPLVTGLPGITRLASSEDLMIVDGTAGVVILHPTAEQLAAYRQRRVEAAGAEARLTSIRDLETVTRDDVRIRLMANIDLPEEVEDACRVGAAGIGLYRSEFLYIERSPELPSEDDHYHTYRKLIESLAPHPVIIRTYDLGGRKLAREVMQTYEENPVLGLRGIRLTLARPQVFRSQLRGLFRAGRHGPLRILLPMVSTVEEVWSFRRFAEGVQKELDDDGVEFARDYELGVMIEVPSAALIADHLAREVDFFSIGTNDLIQYALAVDRNNEHVAELYQPLHPAILRMLLSVTEGARRAGIEVSVCGEMAAEPLGYPVLIGLGVRQLSVSPRRLPTLKLGIRTLDSSELERHVEHCLGLSSGQEVHAYLEEVLGPVEERLAPLEESAS